MAKLIIQRDYWQVPNSLTNNKNISFRAAWIYAYMQSKPDNWNFSAERIAEDWLEWRDAIRAALVELEEHWYLRRVKSYDENWRFTHNYTLFSTPETGKPVTENPTSENQAIIKESKKRNSNNNKKNTSYSYEHSENKEEELVSGEVCAGGEPEEKENKRKQEIRSVIIWVDEAIKAGGFLPSKWGKQGKWGKQESKLVSTFCKTKKVIETASALWMTVPEFAKKIVEWSNEDSFWSWKITSFYNVYYSWEKIYNNKKKSWGMKNIEELQKEAKEVAMSFFNSFAVWSTTEEKKWNTIEYMKKHHPNLFPYLKK